MAALLNEIVSAGRTTAITSPVSAKSLPDWMSADNGASAWHVAEDAASALTGFQWIRPNTALPPEACDITTFVKTSRTQLGIGSR